jgi:hypothetical protein
VVGQKSIVNGIVTIGKISSLNTKGLDDILSGEEVINWREIIAERPKALFFNIIDVEGSNNGSNFILTSIVSLIKVILAWTLVICSNLRETLLESLLSL